MKSTKSKQPSWARRVEMRGVLIGALTVFALWGLSLYRTLDHKVNETPLIDAEARPDKVPTVEAMAERRTGFFHDNVHPHLNLDQMIIIEEQITKLGLAPDEGTMQLIEIMSEHYNKNLSTVVKDLKQISIGNYAIAKEYDVTLERRLVGNPASEDGAKPLKISKVRYEVIQTWDGNSDPKSWKIGKSIFGMGNKYSRRSLPDDSKLAMQSFLDVMPDVMRAD